MQLHKPADLIVTNALYDTVGHLQSLPRAAQGTLSSDQMAEVVARNMVCALGQFASPETLFKLLQAVGAPSTAEEMHQRVASVKEAQATA